MKNKRVSGSSPRGPVGTSREGGSRACGRRATDATYYRKNKNHKNNNKKINIITRETEIYDKDNDTRANIDSVKEYNT